MTRWLTASGFLAFFVFGFTDNLKGPLLPELLRAEGLSYAQGGTFFLAAYLGFMLATLVTGLLADWLNNRRMLLIAGGLMIGGLSVLNTIDAWTAWVLCMFVIGLGLGAIEVGGNGLMVELHPQQRARYLNLLATFHGVGSLIVPLFSAWLLSVQFSWRQVYLCSAGLAACLVASLLLAKSQPQPHAQLHNASTPAGHWSELLRLAFNVRMCVYYVLIAAYVAVELGVAAWLVEYLHRTRQYSIAQGSLYLSLFFAMIMLGRFVGSWWVERVGYLRMVGLSLLATLLLLAIGLWGPPACAILLPLSGLSMSTVFPTVTASATVGQHSHVGALMGVLFTFGGLGGALGPWLIGLASEAYGVQTGLSGSLLFAVVALVALLWLQLTSASRTA